MNLFKMFPRSKLNFLLYICTQNIPENKLEIRQL